jgi:hypothetical protein
MPSRRTSKSTGDWVLADLEVLKGAWIQVIDEVRLKATMSE